MLQWERSTQAWPTNFSKGSFTFDTISKGFILTHRLNQDCLENFFSQVRGKLRFKKHPNAVECLYNIKAVILGKNPHISKQLDANTIDQQLDEYVTFEFCFFPKTKMKYIKVKVRGVLLTKNDYLQH